MPLTRPLRSTCRFRPPSSLSVVFAGRMKRFAAQRRQRRTPCTFVAIAVETTRGARCQWPRPAQAHARPVQQSRQYVDVDLELNVDNYLRAAFSLWASTVGVHNCRAPTAAHIADRRPAFETVGSRQRRHAGRMLFDIPGNPSHLRFDEARCAFDLGAGRSPNRRLRRELDSAGCHRLIRTHW